MPEGGEIKLPGLGKVDKKYAIGGLLAAVAIVIVVAVRRKSAAANASSAPAVDASDASDAIDPATGIPYAEEQDSAEAQLASLGGDEADYGDGAGNLVADTDAAGYPIGSAADLAWQAQQEGLTGTGASSGITTNSQWLTEAMDTLPGDQTTIQTALTMVLGGLAVTTAQQDLFLEAVGVIGPPPQGYPQPVKLVNTAATSTGTTAGTPTGKPTGKPVLKLGATGVNSQALSWTPVAGAAQYQVNWGANYGNWHTNISGTSTTINALRSKTAFTFAVQAFNSQGYGPYSAQVHATTK
jgi:hypothetical protein